jgi:RNA polymerase sigma-70 factor, ECF subfamily
LPDKQRTVVVLIDLEQLTAPEAAQVLGINANTIYSRLRLGRQALSAILKEQP